MAKDLKKEKKAKKSQDEHKSKEKTKKIVEKKTIEDVKLKEMSKKNDSSSESKLSFSIREIEIYDLGEVYELGELCFKADRWPMLYRGWDEYEVTTMFNTDREYCLVAENDDYDEETSSIDEQRIVGFVLGTVMAKPGTAWTYGYIVWLCAHPDWQREGVASKLVDKSVELMVENDGVRIIMSDTDPRNDKAVKFFKKKGFAQEHEHVFLTSNIENNDKYSHLLERSRAAALEEQYLKKIRRLATKSGVSPKKIKKKQKAKKKGS